MKVLSGRFFDKIQPFFVEFTNSFNSPNTIQYEIFYIFRRKSIQDLQFIKFLTVIFSTWMKRSIQCFKMH